MPKASLRFSGVLSICTPVRVTPYDGSLYAPFHLSNSARAPLPFYGPKIQFADGDERERNRFPLDERTVEISPSITRFVQVGENVSIKKEGVHRQDVLPSILVNCI